MNDLVEHSLIQRIVNNDKNAFKEIYEHYANMMFIFCSRKINNETDAYDLVQELFVRVWNNRQSLDTSKSIKPYLYKIASNLTIDYLRRLVSRTSRISSDNEADGISYQTEGFDISERINEEIGKLPDQQRDVFCLSKYENLKYSEISEIMNISVKTVENHMGRALKKLREGLTDILFIIFSLWVGLQK